MIALAGWLLTACTHRTYPASVSLCADPEPAPGWQRNVHVQRNDRFGTIEYYLTVADAPSPGVRDGKAYAVVIGGMSGGQRATPPRPAFPMWYAPVDAWVEIDGRRLVANPNLYSADPLQPHAPGSPFTLLPVDLNVPAEAGASLEPHVFVVFPMTQPRVDSQWRVHLGTIRLDGEQVALPEYRSCYKPPRTEPSSPWQG